MKKIIGFFFCLSSLLLSAQSKWEPSFNGGVGYISDKTGSGLYQYVTGGAAYQKDNLLIGGFATFVNVDVTFNGYNFTANEYTIGPSLVGWGIFSKNYDYAFWLMPGAKFFSDHGKDALMIQEVWQKDIGTYSLGGANLTDKKNRWFHSYKLQIQYQKNFWSKKDGLVKGNISDSVNFKAVNKAYLKTQFEVAAKRFNIKNKARLEPKLVIGHLYDGGVKKNYLEFGTGIAISFTNKERYYEPFNLQYRARYDVAFTGRLDVIELNVDAIAFYKLLKK